MTKVNLTQKEFDELMSLNKNLNVYGVLDELSHEHEKYPALHERLFFVLDTTTPQAEFANLWKNIDRDHPELTVSVQLHKWYVIDKETNDAGLFRYLDNIDGTTSPYTYGDEPDDVIVYGYEFETKEEAEKWTTPLTKAVSFETEGLQ